MSGYSGKTTNWRNEITAQQAQAEREAMWGEIPGKVVSFDASTQTATIQPLYKPRFNGEPVEMPELYEVPVRFSRAGGFVITSPIREGDTVTLRPQMRSSENWHGEGNYEASDARSFSLADYEAFLDGGESITDPIPAFNSENMEIRSADGKFAIEMSEDGKFRIRGAEGNLYTILAEFMELVAGDQLQIAYGSSAGSGHALQNRDKLMELAGKVRAMAL